MIVMLNTLQCAEALETAGLLAARFEAGEVLSLWGLSTDEAQLGAAQLKARGAAHLVAAGTFHDCAALARQRVSLGHHDDEVYAFLLDLWSEETGTAGLRSWRAALEDQVRSGDIGLALNLLGRSPAEAAAKIWDDLHEPVELCEPDAQWQAMFARERRRIEQALGGVALRVEHVGSTAVSGLLAKPIIDVLVIVGSLDDAAGCIAPLAGLGYAFVDYPQNTDRRFFRKGKPRTHHIQIVEHDSPAARAYIGFRDALRADPSLREEYAALKRASQRELKHRRAQYGERKSELIRRALQSI